MSDCVFCRIVRKEIAAEVLEETPAVLAFKDVHPQAPVHILVIPKRHIPRLMDVAVEDGPLIADIHRVIQSVARKLSLSAQGFRVVVNNGSLAGQAVDHLHYHVLGGRKLGWPPG
jgi:histidine triad (HIT) family protein